MILGEALDGVSVNVDRRLVYVNQALCNMLGYTREELLSMDVLDLHAPEYREGVKEYTSMRQKREAAPSRYVVKLLRKDGAQVDVEYQVSLIDWMGETASLTYVRDVSERKRFEVTLQTLHESALAFNEIDSYEDIIEESLNILEKIVGYRYLTFLRVEEEALVTASTRGAPVLDLVLPLSGPGITVRAVREKKTQQVNDTSIDPDFVKGSTDSLSELAVPVIVEDDVWAVLNVESQERDAFTQEDLILVETLSSHVSSAVSRMMDQENRVKEALMYQRMIEASEKRYRTLVESSPDLIIEHDLEGNIVFYNEAAERFLGFDPDTSIEMNVLDVVPPEYLGELEERSRKRGTWDMGVFSYELKLINASGELVPVLINSTPIQENGTVKSILLMIRNVSEYKRLQNERTEALLDAREAKIRAEEAEKLAQLKTRFMSTATHELRTPLTVIQGYLELLKDTIDANTESANQYLEIVERNTMRLNKLTDDLLEQQRLEEKRVKLDLEEANLSQLVNEIIDEMKPILETRNQRIDLSCDDAVATVDRVRVGEVLVNLVDNASKFSPKDSVITLDVAAVGDVVRFSVVDHGVGIREEDMDKLFTPFPGIRVKGVKDGTGLGLSICKGIVELHGGEIWAESGGPGEGSTFTFTIPMRRGEDNA
ncbi:MAG: PAS domain S-box protein [Deltaproteobacteria bacterium]|nr:PAS domain S-box protein [Deltaproteobacteria bacterium]